MHLNKSRTGLESKAQKNAKIKHIKRAETESET